MKKQHIYLRDLLLVIISICLITGLIVDGPLQALKGFLRLQISPTRLLSDFVAMEGVGATLVNSALVGLFSLLLILKNKVKLSGPTYAAVFTIMGFGMFGKTVLNITPILLGVYLAAKFVNKEYKEYIIIALFGTALGPVVSLIAFEFGLSLPLAILLSTGMGLITGFLLPAAAVSMLHLHQGYNLYNMGLTCGFLGLFISSYLKIAGKTLGSFGEWDTTSPLVMKLLVPVLSVILLVTALFGSREKIMKNLKKVQKAPGRLPSDFMDIGSPEAALINSAIIGLLYTVYLLIIGGDFNGPVIGGVLTIMGFGAFGTNLRNSWPVALGVILATLIFGHGLSDPGPILAVIFVTTLGPLAGEFGWFIGLLAGFTHLVMVMQTGSWHGFMNLYNNGFAGGLTASIFVALIQWYKTNKTEFKDTFRSKK